MLVYSKRVASPSALDEPLFDWMNISLAVQLRPGIERDIEKYRDETKKFLIALDGNTSICNVSEGLFDPQLVFQFGYMPDTPDNIVNLSSYVRASLCRGALDREVTGFFGRHAKLRKLCSALYHDDIKYLGDFIALTEDELMSYRLMNREKLDLIKDDLKAFNFELGVKPLGWKRPSEFRGRLLF
jgi:hypothetical protein